MRIRHDSNAYRELLRSEAMREEVKRRADRIATAAGPGFQATSMIGRNRARASVSTTDIPSIIRNSRDQTLLRALDAGRE
jgi:hypothetical protein